MVNQVQLSRPQPLYRQLLSHYEEAIASGSLAPGDRLPATMALAQRFQVAAATVQEALGLLQKRGLVERVPGRGTVVSTRACARTWGVVFGEPVLASADRRVYALVVEHLVRLLRARGCDLRIYHPDPDGSLDGAWQDIERDAAAGRLRVLLPLAPSAAIDRQLERSQPVPVAHGSPWTCDFAAFARLGLEHLRRHGRRRVAMVAPDAGSAAGLIAGSGAEGDATIVGHANTERGGFACTDALLRGGGLRPDAWLVADDNACRGVMTALLWHRVAIPGDMALISHANHGIELVAPLPLTRLEFDPAAMASASLAAADALLAGEPFAPPALAPTLVPGATCGEAP